MATKDSTLEADLKFFDFLYTHRYPNKSKRHYKALRKLVKCGEIQIETMFENTIASLNPSIEKDSTDGRDFTDGSDAKKVTSMYRNNNIWQGTWTNSYSVRGVKNKHGGLRVLGYNVYKDKFEMFAIPYHAYSHIGTVLEIPIERYCGYYDDPGATGERTNWSKWYQYEVSTLHELANTPL